MGVVLLTAVNLLIVSMAADGGVHYMESSEFCGQVCHTTMEPEYRFSIIEAPREASPTVYRLHKCAAYTVPVFTTHDGREGVGR